jgi:hypothetical protein
MTGRQDEIGRSLRSLLLEEASAMPVDAHAAAAGLRRRIAHTRKRRRVTLAVAASVVVAVAVTAAGGLARCRPGGRPGGEPGRGCRARVPCRVRQLRRRQSDQLPDRRCHRPALGHPRAAPPGLRPLPGPGLSGDGNDCEQVGNSESGVSLVCAFDMHGIKSDEIGLGPYIDNYWNLTVRDGRIDSACQRMAYLSNGFSKQMWEPFAAWVRVEHPGDIVAMYTDESQEMQRVTEDSNRLWELRTAEYVAAVTQNPAAYLDRPEVAAYVAQVESIFLGGASQSQRRDPSDPGPAESASPHRGPRTHHA